MGPALRQQPGPWSHWLEWNVSDAMPHERWLPVGGWEGFYAVSDAGRVKSLPRTVRGPGGHPRRVKERILKASVDENGRCHVALARDGDTRTYRVHRLVLMAFIGPPDPGEEACHNDGSPSNNALSNLRWDSHAGNMADKNLHGTSYQRARTHCPLRHPLVAPNLSARHQRRGSRACLACIRARASMQKHRRAGRMNIDLQSIADAKYAAIMSTG